MIANTKCKVLHLLELVHITKTDKQNDAFVNCKRWHMHLSFIYNTNGWMLLWHTCGHMLYALSTIPLTILLIWTINTEKRHINNLQIWQYIQIQYNENLLDVQYFYSIIWYSRKKPNISQVENPISDRHLLGQIANACLLSGTWYESWYGTCLLTISCQIWYKISNNSWSSKNMYVTN